MEQGRCKTCTHWKRLSDSDAQYFGPHAGKCASDSFVYDDDMPADGLEYWDHEGYSADFNTGEDFGCVHWAPITASQQPKE